jgi:hypothetical protein
MKFIWIVLVGLVAGLLMKYIFSPKSAQELDDAADDLENFAWKQQGKGLKTNLDSYYKNAENYRKTANDTRIAFFIVGALALIIIIILLIT